MAHQHAAAFTADKSGIPYPVQAKPAALSPGQPRDDTDKLQDTVKTIDGIASEGFGHIEAVALLGMRWLETPDAHRGGGVTLHTILSLIRGQANNYDALIGDLANEAGCSDRHERLSKWGAVMDAARTH